MIPVIVQLRHLSVDYVDRQTAVDQLARDDAPELARLYQSSSRHFIFVIFFDGLDEVNASLRISVEKSLLHNFSDNDSDMYCITSRKDVINMEYREYSKYEIGELDDFSIKRWCYEFVSSRENWKRFYTVALSDPDTREVLRNPLFLMLAANLYSRYALFPNRKSEIYEDMVHALIEDWDRRRGITRSVGSWDSPRQKAVVLSHIAYSLVH